MDGHTFHHDAPIGVGYGHGQGGTSGPGKRRVGICRHTAPFLQWKTRMAEHSNEHVGVEPRVLDHLDWGSLLSMTRWFGEGSGLVGRSGWLAPASRSVMRWAGLGGWGRGERQTGGLGYVEICLVGVWNFWNVRLRLWVGSKVCKWVSTVEIAGIESAPGGRSPKRAQHVTTHINCKLQTSILTVTRPPPFLPLHRLRRSTIRHGRIPRSDSDLVPSCHHQATPPPGRVALPSS